MPATALAPSPRGRTAGRRQPTAKKTRSTTARKPSSNVVNLRVDNETYLLIERAREAKGENRTDFMLESARLRAKQILLDRTQFTLSDSDWKKFQSALEAPSLPTKELVALMARKAPWDQ